MQPFRHSDYEWQAIQAKSVQHKKVFLGFKIGMSMRTIVLTRSTVDVTAGTVSDVW